MNFTTLLLIAYAMSMATTQDSGATGSMQTTDDMLTSDMSMSTAAPKKQTTTAAKKQTTAKTMKTTKAAKMGTTAGTTGMGTTDGMGTSADPGTKPKQAEFTVTTKFTNLTTAQFDGAKAKLTTVFAGIFNVQANQLALTFEESKGEVTVVVTGITEAQANANKAKVEKNGGGDFTKDLNKGITDAGVTGVVSTGSAAKVKVVTAAPDTTKAPETTSVATGSCSALTVLAGLLAFLAY